jgi:putative salt-induced outer membrane protein
VTRTLASCFAFTVALTAVAGQAWAAPIPIPVEAMIDAAADDPARLDVIADVAKKTNPNSVAEIDAKVAFLRDDAEKRRVARLSSLGFREGWTGQGEAGGSITTGNTDESALTVGINLSKETYLRRHRFTGVIDDRKSNGVQTANRYFAGYQGDYKFDDRLYANLLASWEKDPFAGLQNRMSESAGVGYRILPGGAMTLDVDIGIAARQTQYLTGDNEATIGARTGARYEWKLARDTVLSEIASAYIDNQSNTVESATSVTTKLVGALSWRGSFNIRYESAPPILQESTDTTTRFSLVYSF